MAVCRATALTILVFKPLRAFSSRSISPHEKTYVSMFMYACLCIHVSVAPIIRRVAVTTRCIGWYIIVRA
jgi:hypothetical protein